MSDVPGVYTYVHCICNSNNSTACTAMSAVIGNTSIITIISPVMYQMYIQLLRMWTLSVTCANIHVGQIKTFPGRLWVTTVSNTQKQEWHIVNVMHI